MAVTIWKAKTDIRERTNCPKCGSEFTIYCGPSIRCPECMEKVKPDLRDITSRVYDRCLLHGVKG